MKNEDYTLNEDMTCASLEEILRLQNLLGFAKRFQETGDLMDGIHEEDRFYGTVPSPEALKKMEEVNRLLDVIAVNDDFTVDKFIQPKPRCRKAIVAVTANAFEEDRKQALEAGMNTHLAKPYDIPKMMETLAATLK